MHSAARRTIPERTLAPHSFFQSAIFTRVGCLPDPKSKKSVLVPRLMAFASASQRVCGADSQLIVPSCAIKQNTGVSGSLSQTKTYCINLYHIQQSHLQNHPWVMPKHGSHQHIHHKSGFLTGCPETTASHTIRREHTRAISMIQMVRNWERELFGGAYDDAKGFDRCKYGALRLGWSPEWYGSPWMTMMTQRVKPVSWVLQVCGGTNLQISCCLNPLLQPWLSEPAPQGTWKRHPMASLYRISMDIIGYLDPSWSI